MKYLIILLLVFATSAFAQEKFVPSVAGIETVDTYRNASALDGVNAVLPSPQATSGEYALYFDLGYWLPANTSVTVNVYGDVPFLSNLLVTAITDEAIEGFSHRVVAGSINTRPDNAATKNSIACKWPFAVRHICLLRSCGTTPSVVNADGTITPGRSEYQNGRDCLIDAVSIQSNKPVPCPYKIPYSHFVINSSAFGKTICPLNLINK